MSASVLFDSPGPRTVARHRLYSLAVVPTDYGLLCVAFLLLGLPAVFAPVYALFLLANVVFLAVGLRRWSRELRSKG